MAEALFGKAVEGRADQRSVASNSTGGAGQGPPKEQVLTDITPTSPPRAIIIKEGED